MVLALAAAQKRDVQRMRLWLLATALLGMTFVGGQVYEFTALPRGGPRDRHEPVRDHVLRADGVPRRARDRGDLDAAVARGDVDARGRLPDDPAFPVEMVGLYWHFVDIVWIVIFTVVYLIPTPTPAGRRRGRHRAWPRPRSDADPPRPRHARRCTERQGSTSGSASSWRCSPGSRSSLSYSTSRGGDPDPDAVRRWRS